MDVMVWLFCDVCHEMVAEKN